MKKSIILLLLILCSCANSNPKVEKKNISKITDKFIFTNGECLRDNVKIYYSSFNRGDILEIVDEDKGYYYVKKGGLILAVQKDYIRTENEKEFKEYHAYTRNGSKLYSNIECDEAIETFSLNDEVNVIDDFAGMLFVETNNQRGYMKHSQISKNKIPKYVAPKPVEKDTYTPESNSGGGGSSSGSSSPEPAPSAPPASVGDGEEFSLAINIPKHENHFLSYSQEIYGTILMDGTKSYITTMNRNDAVYILEETDDQYIILINGYKGSIDKKYVRKENEASYEKFDAYTTSGAKLYKDFDMQEKMFMFGINEKVTIIDEVDNIYIVQISTGEVGYMKKANVSKKKIVITPKKQKPEVIEETPSYSGSSGSGSSSSSSSTPSSPSSSEDWTPPEK